MLLTLFLLWVCCSKSSVSVSVKWGSWTNRVTSYCNFLFFHQISLHSAFSFFFKLTGYWPWALLCETCEFEQGAIKTSVVNTTMKTAGLLAPKYLSGQGLLKEVQSGSLAAFSSQLLSVSLLILNWILMVHFKISCSVLSWNNIFT